jgi:LacI family transcriptional regulator
MQKHVRDSIGINLLSPTDAELKYGTFFFQGLWNGIYDQLDKEDYSSLRYQASVRDSDSCDAFIDGRVDGILFHAHSNDNKRPARIASAGMPIVLLTRSRDIPNGCGAVYVDEDEVVNIALTHLWSLGHRRIAHIAGPINDTGTEVGIADDIAIWRMRAYEAWMAQAGISAKYVEPAISWDGTGVADIIDAWNDGPDRPTAIFCANDRIAVVAMDRATQLGWSLPCELSIVGVDNDEIAIRAAVPLTTIEVPIERVGQMAVKLLVNMIKGTSTKGDCLPISGSRLIVRESTKAYSDNVGIEK